MTVMSHSGGGAGGEGGEGGGESGVAPPPQAQHKVLEEKSVSSYALQSSVLYVV